VDGLAECQGLQSLAGVMDYWRLEADVQVGYSARPISFSLRQGGHCLIALPRTSMPSHHKSPSTIFLTLPTDIFGGPDAWLPFNGVSGYSKAMMRGSNCVLRTSRGTMWTKTQ
jgi:hypothetical protein